MSKLGRVSKYIHSVGGRRNIPLRWDERHPGPALRWNDTNYYGFGITKLPQRKKVVVEGAEHSVKAESSFDEAEQGLNNISANLLIDWKEYVKERDDDDLFVSSSVEVEDESEEDVEFLHEFFPEVDDRLSYLMTDDEAYLKVLDLEMDDCWYAAELIGRDDRDENPLNLIANANASTLRKIFGAME